MRKLWVFLGLLGLLASPVLAQTETTIRDMPDASSVDAGDGFACDQGTGPIVTRECLASQIKDYVKGAGGAEEEGEINSTSVTGDADDDKVLLGTAATAAAWTLLADCPAGMLRYSLGSNTFSCGSYVAGHSDGANCSTAGEWPAGVDASGAVQGCGSVLPLNEADQTTDGQLDYDTVEEVLEVGDDGTATLKFYPNPHFTPNADPATDHSSYVPGHGDGNNCSAGNYPLGVDASGAVQDCTADDDVPDSNEVTPNALKSTGQTDEYVLTYEQTGNTLQWQEDDDVPESGDFGNATDLDSDGSISAGALGIGETTDDIACPASQYVRRNSGDTAWECGSPAGSGDIEDVWSCSSGNCNALTAASGDTLNAGSADSTAPNKIGTAPPGTCSVGDTYFDTDATAGQRLLMCDPANTWSAHGDGGGAPGTDSVGTDQLDDDANTPTAGYFVIVEDGAASFDYLQQVGDTQIADGAVDGGSGGEIADGSITADDLGSDSVSAEELNATGVEAELEAVLDLPDLQGQISDTQIANDAIDGGAGGEIADGSITKDDLGPASVEWGSEVADDLGCTGLQHARRNSGDTAWECAADDDVPDSDEVTPDALKSTGQTDEYCLTYEETGDTLAWQTCGGSGGGMGVDERYFSAAALLPVAKSSAADGIPPVAKATGTNTEIFYRAYDDTADECAGGTIQVHEDVDSSGTVTLRLKFYAATGASASVSWDFYEIERDTGEVWDTAYNLESDGGCATGAATQNMLVECTWTETITNLGWAAKDTVEFEICRDGDGTNGTDSLTGDAHLVDFVIEVPIA